MIYAIFCRYEFINNNGKKFTDYFNVDKFFNNEKDAKSSIKELKKFTDPIDKITKLKHEYKYEYVDETLFPQSKMHRPKGRPKKIDNKYLDELINELNKNKKVSVLKEIGCYLYNDKNAQNYISSHIKDNTKWTRYWYDDDNILYIILKDNSEKIYEKY